ncbi:MAG TPA: C13 family peptidase [Stellaceae bacterium]|nr:C13 family peptidase [Stellaceae bacterium]
MAAPEIRTPPVPPSGRRPRARWATARLCALVALAAAAIGAAPAPLPARWHVVLVAGDTAQPVFDNAVRALDLWLTAHGVPAADIHRLAASAGPQDPAIEPATLDRVLGRIASLRPAPGDGCFVFITSHGAPRRGLYLSRADEMLRPAPLARALDAGCGAAPTVVVVSSCYSGAFARPPVAAANRIVLTAARADRPSFGCAAERTYTVYDSCLLGALPHAATWGAAFGEIRRCVELHERELGAAPSFPQASFGAALRRLKLQF